MVPSLSRLPPREEGGRFNGGASSSSSLSCLMLFSICNNCKYGSYRYGRILGDDICWVLCLYVSYEETNGWGRIYFLAGRTTWII